MDTPRQSLGQFRTLFANLPPRQRMTLIAIPLIVLAVLVFLTSVRGAGSDEAVLAGKTFNARELREAQESLRKSGLTQFRVSGRKILAPRAEIARYNAALDSRTGKPRKIGDGLLQAITSSFWKVDSGARQEWIEFEKREEVAEMIRRFPLVHDVHIVSQRSRPSGFSRDERKTATLFVTLKNAASLSPEFQNILQKSVGSALGIAERDITVCHIESPRPERTEPAPAAAATTGATGSAAWAASGGLALAALVTVWTLSRGRKRQPALAVEPQTATETKARRIAAGPQAIGEQPETDAKRTVANPPLPDARRDGGGSSADAIRPGNATVHVPAAFAFDFLREAPADHVLTCVTEEHPQTIAQILSHLPAPLAGEVLRRLPSTRQVEVVSRVATLQQVDPDILRDVAAGLQNRLAARGLRGGAPLDGRARRLMMVFDDLLLLDDQAVPPLFARVDSSKWALALKGASDDLRLKLIRNLPPSDAARLADDLRGLGPVRVRDIAAAQQQIVDMVQCLEDAGDTVAGVGDQTLRSLA